MKDFKYNGKTQTVTDEILVDKFETEVDVNDFDSAYEDLQKLEGSNTIMQKNKKTIVKLNLGKDSSGFNLGATPTKVKESIDTLDMIDINVKGTYSIEYCINILVDFDPIKENKFWADVYNMLVENKFNSSTVSLSMNNKVKRNSNITADNMTSMKGYKNGITCKIYDKFFEKSQKGKLETNGSYLLRMEISFNKKGLNIYKIDDIEDLTKIKKIFTKYINCLRKESKLKVSRYNKKTHVICDKFLECLK